MGLTGPVAETTYGKVQGALIEGAVIFLGVPYGGSTSGRNRFGPPTAPAAWEGIRDATVHGPWPPQPAPLVPHLAEVMPKLGVWLSHGSDLPPASEDCLNLNVFTPSVGDGADRPVMVWFHGGGCTAGSGNESSYDGSALARKCDVVVVTVNARLGVLGYLYLGGLGADGYEASGSAGALDHIAALRWVRDNIRSFGGNPDNVTIFGESGGGMKTSVLLAMPEAHGLFHRAIIQSGIAESIRVHTPESATEVAVNLLAELGISTSKLNALRDVPARRLIEAADAAASQGGGEIVTGASHMTWRPVVDGTYLPEHPHYAVNGWRRASVPLLIGTNAHEASLFTNVETPADEPALRRRVEVFAGDRAGDLIDLYRRKRPDLSDQRLYLVMMSDWLMRAPTLNVVDRWIEASTQPVFVYLFTWESSVLDGIYGSFHGLEIPLVFNHPDRIDATAGVPGAHPLAALMADTWVAFARSGDPNHGGLPSWPRYAAAGRPTMIFDGGATLREDPFKEERLAWMQ